MDTTSPDQKPSAVRGHEWAALSKSVDSLAAAWEAGTPPDLASLLPAVDETMRRIILVELIKVDLKLRWPDEARRKLVREYVIEHAELAEGSGCPPDLLFEEFRVRRQAGEDVTLQDYQDDYPSNAETLARLFADGTSGATTVLTDHRPPAEIEVGGTIDEFDLLLSLGQGAFGQVFLARQRSMQRLVALKITSIEGDEPQTLAQLDHPFIVRVFDQRTLPERDLRLLYMQFVPGGTLQRIVGLRRAMQASEITGRDLIADVDASLSDAGQVAPAESSTRAHLASAGWGEVVAWIGSRLAAALEYAHTKQVMHRDIKPANVLLDAEGSPKLADFNISYCSKVDGASPAAFFGGSLPYMSPEQLEVCSPRHRRSAAEIDARSDLFSLGVVLWELLTGELPFGGEKIEGDWATTVDTMIARRNSGEITVPIASLPPDCPAGLVEVVQRCLECNPADRWPSGAELARNLSLCLLPGVRRLLDVDRSPLRRRLVRHPYLSVLAAVVIPNALAAIFNYDYNVREVVEGLTFNAQRVFWNVEFVVNFVAFGFGILLIPFFVSRAARWLPGNRDPTTTAPVSVRKICLRLGQIAVALGIAEWLVAGIVYPVSIHSLTGGLADANLVEFYLTFVGSLTICGLIAAAYPFFAVTLLSLEVFFPAILAGRLPDSDDLRELTRLGGLSQIFLAVAALVPMVGVALVTIVSGGNRTALTVLSIGGAFGFFLAFWLYRRMQQDLALLKQAAQMGNTFTSASQSESSRF